jgi:protein TonB
VARQALVLREGSAPIRDRLLTTLFLAGVLHGIIILGLTFSVGANDGESAPGLEVLLVSDEVPAADRNDSATYLAQRTQLGSGNTRDPVPAHNRQTTRPIVAHDGLADGVSLDASGRSRGGTYQHVLATTALQPDIRYFTDSGEGDSSKEKPLLITDRTADQPGPEDELGPAQLRGPQRDELWITPDSREATLAPYLDSWRRKVERIGTLNYPTAARNAGVQASPIVEVAIGADGRLVQARIRRASGFADLDHAALEILKLASPFDPFPPELAAKYHTLRFAYAWVFMGGRVQSGAVSTVP